MTGRIVSADSSRFPLIEDRAKGLKLVGVLAFGRLLRDFMVPVGGTLGRGVYAGTVIGLMLFILARPGMSKARASLSAIVGGIATAVLMVW